MKYIFFLLFSTLLLTTELYSKETCGADLFHNFPQNHQEVMKDAKYGAASVALPLHACVLENITYMGTTDTSSVQKIIDQELKTHGSTKTLWALPFPAQRSPVFLYVLNYKKASLNPYREVAIVVATAENKAIYDEFKKYSVARKWSEFFKATKFKTGYSKLENTADVLGLEKNGIKLLILKIYLDKKYPIEVGNKIWKMGKKSVSNINISKKGLVGEWSISEGSNVFKQKIFGVGILPAIKFSFSYFSHTFGGEYVPAIFEGKGYFGTFMGNKKTFLDQNSTQLGRDLNALNFKPMSWFYFPKGRGVFFHVNGL